MTHPEGSRSPRVWMNVTTSVNWSRPAVGVVRVEQELFKALSDILGERLIPCVLADGQFVPHSGPIGPIEASASDTAESFVWPDPSYDFPQAVSLEPKTIQRVGRSRPVNTTRLSKPTKSIEFGDALLSVGLDWDWDTHSLDSALFELKTQKDVKVITCCYDLIPVLFPQYCVGDVAAKFREYFTNLTWASSGMLCISQRSEADYRALATDLGMPSIPTKVMLLGNKLPRAGDTVSDQVASICDGRFVLFVATIERRKNHEVLYKAVHILAERGHLDPEFKLVFVGMPGWGVGDLLKDIELDPLVREQIIWLTETNDAELRCLYEACEFFTYPSFYEGWGLPVAEALAFGKFVVASNRGSIPEVGGDLVEYVDPWNASAWADALQKYWNDPELVRSRAARIQHEYQPVHWHETAAAVLQLIDTLSAEPMKEIELEPGYDLHTVTGVPYGARIIALGQTGTLCHGPYRPLPKGPIRVDVEIEKLDGDPAQLEFKFTAEKGRALIHKQKSKIRKSSTLKFEFELKRNVDDFEVVVECLQGAELAINKIVVHIL